MVPEEADGYQVGSLVNLTGYTSTTKKFSNALGFATEDCEEWQTPVILEINFLKPTGFFELTPQYSAYPSEQEILVQDGLQYLITSNTEEETTKSKTKYRLIKLKYPANG